MRRTTTAASHTFLALPHSFGATAAANEQFVYRRSTVLARILAPASSRCFRDPCTAERTCLLVVSHGFTWSGECNGDVTPAIAEELVHLRTLCENGGRSLDAENIEQRARADLDHFPDLHMLVI